MKTVPTSTQTGGARSTKANFSPALEGKYAPPALFHEPSWQPGNSLSAAVGHRFELVNEVSLFHQFFRRQGASNFQTANILTLGAIDNDAVEEEIG